MMNKLFLLAVLVSMLFAVPLAFAAASDDAAAGASMGASSSESAVSSSGTGVSASSETKGDTTPVAASEIAPSPKTEPAPTSLPPANEIAPAPLPTVKPKPVSLPPAKEQNTLPTEIAPKTTANDTYSVILVPSSASLTVGQSQQFEAYLVVNGGVPQDVDFAWSTTGGVGSVTQNGLFTATAAGNGEVTATYAVSSSNLSSSMVSGSAHVIVANGPPPPPGNNSTAATYVLVLPTNATLNIGDTQQFNAYLVVNGSITSDVPFTWSATGGVGSISTNGLFSATSAGTGTVVATYSGANTTLTGSASVVVNSSPPPPPPANISYIVVTPDPVSLFVGQSQQFIATAYDASGTSLGVLSNANLNWSATSGIGTINANGAFSASAVGSGMVTAVYTGTSPLAQISDTASVTVSQFVPSPIGGGGSGGSNNGGASFKTSTTVSFSCAGKMGTVKITVYDSAVKNATVEIIYAGGSKNEKVLVKEITGTTTVSFTPEKAGDYILRVSVGADQTNANFFVPYCGPQSVNVTQNITVRLEPTRELMFTKLVNYPGGFSKRFSVYKITEGQTESFVSDIVLYLNYTGNSTRYDFDILDSVPSSVLARSSQITFADRPSILSNEPKFEWHVKSVSKGGRLSYAYSFGRPLTEQMIALFDAPTIREAATGSPSAKPAQDAGLLSASIGPIFGITVPLLGVVFAFLVLLALLYFFLFGKKKGEE